MKKLTSFQVSWQKNALFIIILVIAILITWQIIDQANNNYLLEQQRLEAQANINLLEQRKKNQALDNEFLKSDYYLDLAIREQTGYLLPEEKLLTISKNKIAEIKEAYQPPAEIPDQEARPGSNFQQWQNFIFNNH